MLFLLQILFKNMSVLELILFFASGALAMLAHGYAQALVANKQGIANIEVVDRNSLDFMRHFDMFGAIMYVFSGGYVFWPKPIKAISHSVIALLAGPVMNLFIAVLLLLPVKLLGLNILMPFVNANLSIAVFTMLPIVPFAGLQVLQDVCPGAFSQKLKKYTDFIEHYYVAILLFDVIIISFLRGTPIIADLVKFITNYLYIFLAMGT